MRDVCFEIQIRFRDGFFVFHAEVLLPQTFG